MFLIFWIFSICLHLQQLLVDHSNLFVSYSLNFSQMSFSDIPKFLFLVLVNVFHFFFDYSVIIIQFLISKIVFSSLNEFIISFFMIHGNFILLKLKNINNIAFFLQYDEQPWSCMMKAYTTKMLFVSTSNKNKYYKMKFTFMIIIYMYVNPENLTNRCWLIPIVKTLKIKFDIVYIRASKFKK